MAVIGIDLGGTKITGALLTKKAKHSAGCPIFWKTERARSRATGFARNRPIN